MLNLQDRLLESINDAKLGELLTSAWRSLRSVRTIGHINPYHIRALKSYKNYSYEHINSDLREGRDNERVPEIDEAMTETRVDIVVARLVDSSYISDSFVEKAYTSTGCELDYLLDEENMEGVDNAELIVIHVPAGTGAVKMELEMGNDYEKEILLQRGLRFTRVNSAISNYREFTVKPA